MPADVGPPRSLRAGPSDTDSGPWGRRRASLLRFEGATTWSCPGDAARPQQGSPRPLALLVPVLHDVGGVVAPAVSSLENSRASTSIFVLQAMKSQRWMPWRLKPKKDVGDCEKPRGAVYQASIRGYPNGETQHPSWGATPT